MPWLSEWIQKLDGQQVQHIVEEASKGKTQKMSDEDDEDGGQFSDDSSDVSSDSGDEQRGRNRMRSKLEFAGNNRWTMSSMN